MSDTQATHTDSRTHLILSAVLLVSGFIVFLVATVFHPGGTDPNNHSASFTVYAHSAIWTADHLVEFVGEAMGIAGLLVLFYALNAPDGMTRLTARVGVVLAGVTLALIAIRLAVDGVVLKRTVDAWIQAPDADKAARFASAETVRWLEEAITSYQGFVLGITLILLASLIVWMGQIARPIGFLLALSGLGYLVSSWIVGVSGFASERDIPSYVAVFTTPIAGVWLLITALRMRDPSRAAVRSSA